LTGADRQDAIESARHKLGDAYPAAQAIQDPAQVDAQILATLAPFATLNCREVSALPPQMLFVAPPLSCAQLDARNPEALPGAGDQTVLCGQTSDAHTKYLLDVAKVQGGDVAGAVAGLDANSGGWNVRVHFTSSGQTKWTALTQEAVASGTGAQVAIVLDGLVLSAPQIQEVITGDAVIAGGGIDGSAAKVLAAQLSSGALPLAFTVESIGTVG
jgi:preprotein translocase subunit SecD